MADYVTTEDGTGVVHTAPSHGRDDFFTGQKYGLPVPNTVDEGGVLTAEAGEFAGTYYKKCDTVVVDRLREVGALLKVSDYVHSYPHAERDEQPVIFRATEQWFLSIDPIRTQMLQEIGEVKWIPESGRNRIDAMVRNRPDWCVSRQRAWGVGIPIFYALPSRSPVMDPEIIERVAKVVEQGGSDAWFALSPEEILPAGYAHPVTGETEFTKETDTLDVWFDAGSSSLIVLGREDLPRMGDARPAVARRHLPGRLRPAPRLVQHLAHPSHCPQWPRAVQDGRDPRLHRGRRGPKDLQAPGQRYRADRRLQPVRRRHPSPLGRHR
jgi:isoleucyl-tRNA synthetase